MRRDSDKKPENTNDSVIDFNKVREKRLDDKRRLNERIFFKQWLGIYTVTGGNDKMNPIEIVDVSEEGCSFQVAFDPEKSEIMESYSSDEYLPVRLYFSQDTYLPISLLVQNSRPCIEEGIRYLRYGCKVDRNAKSYEAYRQFVKFLKLYSQEAHKDTGKVSFFYL